ncbi:MAG: glycosyltransferase family 39 protein, partial [Acidobacteria bacterium]|nr:glycosyltransferase family 39 protein [Acidobacteriota bacterium]
MESATTAATALLLLAGAAWLRLRQLGQTSLWLDEILNVPITRELGTLRWFEMLLPFERENGPLYYLFSWIGLASGLPLEIGFRLPSILAGLAALAIAWAIGRRASGWWITGALAAALLAISPLHVYYSREGRPYALLVLFGALAILGLLGERPKPLLVTAALLGAAATAATAVPLIAGVIALCLLEILGPGERRQWVRVLLGALAALAYSLLYARIEMPSAAAGLDDSLPSIAAMVMNSFAITAERQVALSPVAILFVLLACAGFLMVADRRAARVLGVMALVPVAASIASLVVLDHWYSVRYTIHGLLPY